MVWYSDENTRIKRLPCVVEMAHGHGLQVKLRVLESRVASYEEKLPMAGGTQWAVKEFHRDQPITVNALQVELAAEAQTSPHESR